VRSGDVRVSLVKRHNHVWRIGTPGGAYFVKAWTKDWYDWADALTTGALNADHEAAAYQLLAARGLAVPEVVAVDQTAGNPLGRPLLVTRELAGSPFPEALAQAGDAGERHALVRAVVAYQARMHGIVMAAPGYFGRQGPFGGDWEHGFQSARAYYRAMEIWWRADEEAGADPELVAAARASAGRMRPRVEVALGGWPLLDVAGIAFDLSHPRFGGYRWWRPWFEGYGEPDIDLFRLVLLSTGSGAARRDTMLRRLLAGGTWDELLDVSALHPGGGRAARRR